MEELHSMTPAQGEWVKPKQFSETKMDYAKN